MSCKNSRQACAKAAGTGSSTGTAAIRLVVADDHPIVREGIVANLEQQCDLRVIGEANNGMEALALIEEHRPEIALLDLRMPQMGGLEVLIALHELKLQTKAIVMTTYADEDDIQRSLKAGARAYLLKDCPQQILADAVRRVHEGEVYMLPQIAQKLVDRMQKPQPSPRELEVLKAMAAGKSNKEIGVQLFISEGTVKSHVESLLGKLNALSRTAAVRTAIRRGFVQMA
jgi:two-component system NarL family response regulator